MNNDDVKMEEATRDIKPKPVNSSTAGQTSALLPEPDGKDYQKLMEKYLEKFNKVHAHSQDLWKEEKTLRQALYSYQRRVNSLLDMLSTSEPHDDDTDTFINDTANIARIENLVSENPSLKDVLGPMKEIFQSGDDSTKVSQRHLINLFISESVPELVGDSLDHLEINPQDTEPWLRRQYPNLVVSKFKPMNFTPSTVVDVVESVQPARPVNKRKRKPVRDSSQDQDTEHEDIEISSPQPKQIKTS
ncbi:hypothetical protein CAAN1_04S06040 [[Candida] anglica]|uniref:Uncharacterized protein n=1 Tax=[Candida] anglica TaxID=148631 RepID=A0ABP0E9U4_9ASCO